MRAHLLVLGAPLAALACGCSSTSSIGGSGTTGKSITLHTVATVQGDLTKPMTNALGWTVTLSKAYLSVGPLYYFQGDPVLSLRPRARDRGLWDRVGDVLERPAYAHPGHYIPGAAMGQMTTATTLDLLAGTTKLADGTGVTGVTNSGRFTWQSPPAGDKAAALEGHVVLAEGLATKGAASVRFVAKADPADVFDGNQLPEVDGCSLGAVPGQVGIDMESDGTVTLTLLPSVWFDEVEFSYALPNADGGTPSDAGAPADGGAPTDTPVDITGTLAWRGFLRGVKKGTAYLFSYGK